MTALTLFVERGYYDTKITDIAKAVPMSTGLMFHYFESKEELLLELVKMGAESTKSLAAGAEMPVPPDVFLAKFLAINWWLAIFDSKRKHHIARLAGKRLIVLHECKGLSLCSHTKPMSGYAIVICHHRAAKKRPLPAAI